MRFPRSLPRSATAALLAAAVMTLAAPAYAAGNRQTDATSSIDHVQPAGAKVQLVVSLQGVPDGSSPDLDSVAVSFDGTPVEATAEPLADSAAEVSRTTVLAMDVSNSMKGAKFDAAKAAAKAFLAEVPADVSVGLVTYAGQVTVAMKPTRDLAALGKAIDSLQLSRD